MLKFNCSKCNKKYINKKNYEKHLITKKHTNNEKKELIKIAYILLFLNKT